MNTVLPECLTPELPEKDCVSLTVDDNFLSPHDNSIKEETPLKIESPETSSEVENVTEEILTITNRRNCTKKEKRKNIFVKYTYILFKCLYHIFMFIFNMISSDITTIFELSSKILAIIQQKIGKKLFKHIFLITVLIVALVHSR